MAIFSEEIKQRNPWKTLGSKVVYENNWIRVREDQVIRPDGNPGIYGVVETRIATAVVALTPKQEIYLVGQYRYATEEYSWEIIEGGSDENEDALTAAKRELREEAGLIAGRWQQLGPEFHLSNCHSSEVGVAFLAEDLTETEASPEGTEQLELKRIPFAKCLELVESGVIKDALSIIAVYRAAALLSSRNR